MIELQNEKTYSSRDSKFSQAKSQQMFDKSKSIKFTCSCNSSQFNNNRIVIYLGLTNGSIVAVTLYKQRKVFNKYEDFTTLTCYDQFKHKGPISVLIAETIDLTPVLFSGGADGSIKLWLGDPDLREKERVHHIKTLLEHKSTVIAMAFCKTRSLLISSSSDMSMKIFRMKDKFDKILNPRFECISTIRDFHIKLNKDRDLPYWISTLSLKETDIIELYAGDTKGRILFYHYIDDNYLKYKGTSGHALELEGINKNNFNFLYAVNIHKKWGTIKVVHSVFDNVIYSAGYNNHIVCYNVKSQQKIFEVANSNSKTYFRSLTINNFTQELIIGDDIGNITFIQIFNKSEFKVKAMNNKIISIQSLELFPRQEHVLLVSEDSLTIYKVNRKTKVSNVQHHDKELLKLFVIEPIIIEDKIIEDTKIISCGCDNMIKIWDFLTMECINKISGPELPRKNVEISSVCYLDYSGLIAVGTEIGHIFFWDLNKSQYLPLTYEKSLRHKGIVTDMIAYMSYGKENNDKVECMLSCSDDGLILFWEITKLEIKQSNKKYNYEEIEDMIIRKEKDYKEYDSNQNTNNMSNMNSNRNNTKENNVPNNKEEMQKNQRGIKRYQELKNYKCTPTIKRNIRSSQCLESKDFQKYLKSLPPEKSQLLKQDLQFKCIAFKPDHKDKVIYTGMNYGLIFLWDYVKENFIAQYQTKNSMITKLIFDKNIIISGGNDGVIECWNIGEDIDTKKTALFKVKELEDTDKKLKNNKPIIHDLLMLKNLGVLVCCYNNKKIIFWKYEKDKPEEQLLLTIKKENEVTCLAVDENYGKLLCGTKQRIIMEIDLAEQLNKIKFEHSYEKYAFLKNSANYKEDEIDKKIDNFKIMKSLTQGIGQ